MSRNSWTTQKWIPWFLHTSCFVLGFFCLIVLTFVFPVFLSVGLGGQGGGEDQGGAEGWERG